MTSNARERKNDQLARQIATANLAASMLAEVARVATDMTTKDLAAHYEAYWLAIAVKRQAEMLGGERQALRVKADRS